MSTKAKTKSKTIKGRHYRARQLASGEWQLEIRSTEYGYQTKRLPEGTKENDIHIHARTMLNRMSSQDVPELARKALKDIKLNALIDAFLKVATLSKRDRDNVLYFQKNEPALCAKTLDKYHIIRNGMENHFDKRLGQVSVPYSVTRYFSPLRSMFRDAGKKRLYGLMDSKIELEDYLKGIEWPEDKSGRKHHLKEFQELKIFKAIVEQCKSPIERLKWNTLVSMALITCLRKTPLLNLKWRDVKWNDRYIHVRPEYWGEGKRAPEYVPLTKKLYHILNAYYLALEDKDKTPDICLFEAIRARSYRRRNVEAKKPDRHNWVEVGFRRIIRRTDLFELKKDANGKLIKDWFSFHSLRHSANSLYTIDPWRLRPDYRDYLMGYLGDEKKMQHKYRHSQKEYCDIIREEIDKGDDILTRSLMISDTRRIHEPHEIAWSSICANLLQETFKRGGPSKEALEALDAVTLKPEELEAQGIKPIHITPEELKRIKEDNKVKNFLDTYLTLPTTEAWLKAKAKADEFNQPRKDYKRKYHVYPEEDMVMQLWEASNRTSPVDKERANAYLACLK